MNYLLDTNACIHYLNGSHERLVERVFAAGPRVLAVSSVTVAELVFGAARSTRRRANLERVRTLLSELSTVPFGDACAERFGHLKADLARRGMLLADFDIAIAATSLAGGRVLVSNDADMRRFPGLAVEDWTA
jgi:tRNA(fMet)-specific endonuclease VapC